MKWRVHGSYSEQAEAAFAERLGNACRDPAMGSGADALLIGPKGHPVRAVAICEESVEFRGDVSAEAKVAFHPALEMPLGRQHVRLAPVALRVCEYKIVGQVARVPGPWNEMIDVARPAMTPSQ